MVPFLAAALDGRVKESGAVFEAKFMLPWSFSEEAAAEKYMPQLQHNMWVTNAKTAVLSVITGGGKWVEITLPADPLYQHLLLTAENSRNRARWDGRSAMNLPCRFAGYITARFTGTAMRQHGGRRPSLTRCHSRSSYGSARATSVIRPSLKT